MDGIPKTIIAEFVDQYGEKRQVHKGKGKLTVMRIGDTPVYKMNRAIGVLLGQRVRARRLYLGMTLAEVSERGGFRNVNPKQFIHAIEAGRRQEGVRMGTLYALAHALKCSAADLLPTDNEVMQLAGVSAAVSSSLRAA